METNLKFQEIRKEIIPTNFAINSLDSMFFGWLGSDHASDELSSNAERQEIGYHYRQIRQLLAALPTDLFE